MNDVAMNDVMKYELNRLAVDLQYFSFRGVETIGFDYSFPTCPGFYNIFHPVCDSCINTLKQLD